jgi:hypothetical protein
MRMTVRLAVVFWKSTTFLNFFAMKAPSSNYLQPTKSLGYGRMLYRTNLSALARSSPIDVRYQDAGFTIFGMPIGDNSDLGQYLEDNFPSIARV